MQSVARIFAAGVADRGFDPTHMIAGRAAKLILG
jgi:hypothetical protein